MRSKNYRRTKEVSSSLLSGVLKRAWCRRVTAIVAVAIASLSVVATASAHLVTPYAYSGFSFNGAGSTEGTFNNVAKVAFDQQHQLIYTWDGFFVGHVSRFTVAGVPEPFSALSGASSIETGASPDSSNSDLAVSSSPGTAGNFYPVVSQNSILGYAFDGTSISGFPIPPSGSPCGAAFDPQGHMWYADTFGAKVIQVDPTTGVATGNEFNPGLVRGPCHIAIDSSGYFYIVNRRGGELSKFNSGGNKLYELSPLPESGPAYAIAVDPSTNNVFVAYPFGSGSRIEEFGPNSPDLLFAFNVNTSATGIAVDGTTHDVYVTDYSEVDKYSPQAPINVPDVTTDQAVPTPTTATLQGTVNPDGPNTTDCHFEWGTSTAYGNVASCTEGNILGGSSDVSVSAGIGGLTKGVTYYFRLTAKNATELEVHGQNQTFVAQDKPAVSSEFVGDVNTDGATIHATINPEQGTTGFHIDYGTDTGYGKSFAVPDKPLASSTEIQDVNQAIAGLEPGTEYHYAVVATDQAGTTIGSDHTFKTFATQVPDEHCANGLARQQTGAALLLDCRAYELVSASDTGGYNVESDLVPGQEPFDGYPLADDRVLYGVHDGGIPNTGNPTNHGVDPYVATRGNDGWNTKYVGIPANGTPSTAPFSSSLLAADSSLESFAFGGPNICSPCFEDGSTNIPLRLANGELVKGMAGSSNPAANPSQQVAEPFSEDGSHFVFGSNEKFEAAGDAGGSIYDRNLTGGTTQVVSTLPNGTTMSGGGVGELDISSDGSRIVVGKKVSTDVKGNDYWHPYMHAGTSANSLDLAPGSTTGVLYDGMSSNGTRVFFTTKDKLLGADTDESADIYEAEVDGGLAVHLRLITTKAGVPSNDDACNPPGSPDSWNSVSGEGKCGAVAFAGGAGVASGDGTFYFVSPELLDGSSGVADQVNLYVVGPGGSPKFVATLDSSIGKAPPAPPNHPVVTSTLVSGLENPEALTVDQSNGDIYVVERTGGNRVSRWTAAGAPDNFTAGPGIGTNAISGLTLGFAGRAMVAVDNAPGSLFNGSFYLKKNASTVGVYAATGAELGTLTGFGDACGLAVDQSSGVLYVGDRTGGVIRRFVPTSASTPVSKANYTETGLKPEGLSPCHVAADKLGHVYAAGATVGPLQKFEASDFAAIPPTKAGSAVQATSNDAAVDPSTNDLYVNDGEQIRRYGSAGNLIQTFGSGDLTAFSRGVAVRQSNGHVYATNGSSIVEFGVEPVTYAPIDNPAVVHAVSQADVHRYEDFQVTADGDFAAFGTSLPISGFDNQGHHEIYRYDTQSGNLDCVSCTPTNARPVGDASLAAHGLSVSSDGRVFFTSTEPLVLRDTDSKKDAYEWENGEVQLLSAGTSQFDSGLLSISGDGRDAFFFTRDVLAPEDDNGFLMKLYDAREEGGFFAVPSPPPCAASDECHGPGTREAPAPDIHSIAGTTGNHKKTTLKPCKKGFARKHGRCKKRHRRPHRHPNQRRNG